MAPLKQMKRDDFSLKKVRFTNPGLECSFDGKQIVDGKTEPFETTRKSKYQPHQDLISFKNDLKHYLAKAYQFHVGFDIAEKYLKGEQKQKAIDAKIELFEKIEVTGVSVGGTDELRGIVISGKIESNNGSKCAINTPRIVFSSDKLGYEEEVEKIFELIQMEVFRYVFEGRSGDATLFDDQEEKDEEKIEAPKVDAA
jgi:hypothetical protein